MHCVNDLHSEKLYKLNILELLMESYEPILREIKKILLDNPKGLTILEISEKIGINRNSVAKYMDVLNISGTIEKKSIGPAKVFFLSQRLPLSSFIEITTEGIVILNSNLEIVMVNDFFSKLIKTKKSDLLGKRINEDPLKDFFKNLDCDLKNCINGKECKKEIIVEQGNEKKYFHIKSIPTTLDTGTNGISLVIDDITEHKIIDEKLLESKDLLNKAEEIAKLGSWELDLTKNYLYWSDEIYRIFGIKPQEFKATYEAFLDTVHPEDRKLVDEAYSGSLRDGKDNYEVEHRIIRKSDGEIRFVHEKCEHLRNASGKIIKSIGMVQDITDRKKTEEKIKNYNRTLMALERSNKAMTHITSEPEMLNEICKIIVEECNYPLVWIGYAESDEDKNVRSVASFGFDETYLKQLNVTWADTERGRGPTGTAIRTGKPVMCDNMLTDPKFKPWREAALKYGYASSISLPLKDHEKIFGAITIYSKSPNTFGEDSVKLLSELASDLSFGIATIRQGTAKKEAEQALQISENKLAEIYFSMSEGLAQHEIIYDNSGKAIDYIITDVNPAFEKITGILRSNAIGKKATLLYGTKEAPYLDIYSEVASTGKPKNFEVFFSPMNKHFFISVFSPGKGKFATMFLDISEKKIAEELLKKSEEDYRRIIETSNEGIVVSDNTGKIIFLNQRFADILGYSKEEIYGKVGLDFVDDDYKKLGANIRNDTNEGKNIHKDVKFKRKDGSTTWVRLNTSPLIEDGKQIGNLIMHTDITDIKNAEEEIKHLASFPESNPNPVMELDLNGKILFCNKSTYNILKDLGKDNPQIFLPNEFKKLLDCFEKNPKKSCYYEIKLKDKIYGEYFSYITEQNVIRLYAVDITERKKAEEKIVFQARLLENINDVVYSTDLNLNLTYWNNTAEKIYGKKREDVLGKSAIDATGSRLSTENRDKLMKELFEKGFTNTEVEHRNKDGKILFFEAKTIVLHDKDGKPIGLIGINHDITDLKNFKKDQKKINNF